MGIVQISQKVVPDARPQSDAADAVMSGLVPRSPSLNDWPVLRLLFFPVKGALETGGQGGLRLARVSSRIQPWLHFSSSFKLAGLVLGGSHPLPPSGLLLSGFHHGATGKVPKDCIPALARGKVQAERLARQVPCSDLQRDLAASP